MRGWWGWEGPRSWLVASLQDPGRWVEELGPGGKLSREATGSASKATPGQGVAPREGSAAGDWGQVRGFGSDAPAVLPLKALTSAPPLEVSGGCTCGGVAPGPRGGAVRVTKGGWSACGA